MDNKSIIRLTASLCAVINRPHALMISIIALIESEAEKLTIPCIAQSLGFDRSSTTIETIVFKLIEHGYLDKDDTFPRMRFISLSEKTKSIVLPL